MLQRGVHMSNEVVLTEDLLIERLREAGLRLTLPRRAVLRALAASEEPFVSARLIIDHVQETTGRIEASTVYRILDDLARIGWFTTSHWAAGGREDGTSRSTTTTNISCAKPAAEPSRCLTRRSLPSTSSSSASTVSRPAHITSQSWDPAESAARRTTIPIQGEAVSAALGPIRALALLPAGYQPRAIHSGNSGFSVPMVVLVGPCPG